MKKWKVGFAERGARELEVEYKGKEGKSRAK